MLSQGCMNEVLCNYIPSFPTRYRSTVQSLKWVCFMTSYWVRLVRHTFTVLQGTCVPITIRAGKKIKVWFSSSTVRSSFLAPARQLSILGAVMTWPMRPRPSSQGPLEWFVSPASKQAISLNLRQPTTHGKPPQNRKFLGKYTEPSYPPNPVIITFAPDRWRDPSPLGWDCVSIRTICPYPVFLWVEWRDYESLVLGIYTFPILLSFTLSLCDCDFRLALYFG